MAKYLIEEEIFVEGTDRLLKYSVSNNLNDIVSKVYSITGSSIDSNSMDWILNPSLSISVKNLMNKHNVDYSMTTYLENGYRNIIVNRRVGEQWFYTGFRTKNTIIQNPNTQNNNQYYENTSETSMGTVGCFLGIINLINVIIAIANFQSLYDNGIGLFVWFIVTVVLAITGFLVSKSGHSKGQEGAGIAGMALNGLVILPAIIFFIGAILESVGKRKRY
jgi:hypothetical protein